MRAPRRDEPGRRRHRRHARLAPRARPRPRGPRPGGRGPRSARRRPSRDADGRAHALQQAVPTTFGLKAAGWLVASSRRGAARRGPERAARRAARRRSGDAVGARRQGGGRAAAVRGASSSSPSRSLPWHTDRTRVAELGRGLVDGGGLAREDRARRDPARADRGGRGRARRRAELFDDAAQAEPRRLALAPSLRPARERPRVACSRASLEQEHERAAGAWQAEWPALSGALACTGGAAAAIADVVEGLEVDTERMRRNLELTQGLVSERSPSPSPSARTGAGSALVEALRARASGRGLGEELPRIRRRARRRAASLPTDDVPGLGRGLRRPRARALSEVA